MTKAKTTTKPKAKVEAKPKVQIYTRFIKHNNRDWTWVNYEDGKETVMAGPDLRPIVFAKFQKWLGQQLIGDK